MLFCLDSIRGSWFTSLYFNYSTFLVVFFPHFPSLVFTDLIIIIVLPAVAGRQHYYYQLSGMDAPSNSFRMQSTYINQSTKWKWARGGGGGKENKTKPYQTCVSLRIINDEHITMKALNGTADDEKRMKKRQWITLKKKWTKNKKIRTLWFVWFLHAIDKWEYKYKWIFGWTKRTTTNKHRHQTESNDKKCTDM